MNTSEGYKEFSDQVEALSDRLMAIIQEDGYEAAHGLAALISLLKSGMAAAIGSGHREFAVACALSMQAFFRMLRLDGQLTEDSKEVVDKLNAGKLDVADLVEAVETLSSNYGLNKRGRMVALEDALKRMCEQEGERYRRERMYEALEKTYPGIVERVRKALGDTDDNRSTDERPSVKA